MMLLRLKLQTPLAVLALLAVSSSCGDHRAPEGQQVTAVATTPAPVLAVVNGATIPASDLLLQMQSGQPAEQALRDLIREELLVQEAIRRGLDRDPRVADTQRRAMVEVLLRRQFRDQLGPRQIPRQLVEQAYQKNRQQFQRPELVDVSHFLASARKKDSPERHQAARRLAERAHALATARPLTPDEFLALEKPLKAEAGEVSARMETFETPQRGYTVPAFADAAFALGRPGAVSPVVPSSFGYHVIYLRKRLPGLDRPLEQVEEEIRGRILDEVRALKLMELIDRLEKKLGVRLQPENLATRSEAGR